MEAIGPSADTTRIGEILDETLARSEGDESKDRFSPAFGEKGEDRYFCVGNPPLFDIIARHVPVPRNSVNQLSAGRTTMPVRLLRTFAACCCRPLPSLGNPDRLYRLQVPFCANELGYSSDSCKFFDTPDHNV